MEYKGQALKIVYKDLTRTVYCYDETDRLIKCWDFTQNGFRNFRKCSITRADEITNAIITKLPTNFNPEHLVNAYKQDGYNCFIGTEIVVAVPKQFNYKQEYEKAKLKVWIYLTISTDVNIWIDNYGQIFVGKQNGQGDIVDVTKCSNFQEFKQAICQLS